MTQKLTFLGSGPGGYLGAIKAAQLGAEVNLIEADSLGGACLNYGCIPTKTLRASAEAFHNASRLKEFGLNLDGSISVDMDAVIARKDKVVDLLVKSIGKILSAHNVNLIKGKGTVISPQKVLVETPDGENLEVNGDKLILATGSTTKNLPGITADGAGIINSDHALNLKEIPESIVVLGGGVIGLEFGFILSHLGSKVTIVEALDRVLGLPSVDEASSKIMARELKKNKIALMLNRSIKTVETLPNGRVRMIVGASPFLENPGPKESKEVELEADKLLVSVGRAPQSAGIGLENLSVAMDGQGWVLANEKMETNVKDVYAIGDLLGPRKVMLAHAATAEAMVAVENCMGGNKSMDYNIIPTGIFTFPELASVGLTETAALEQGCDCRADVFLLRGLGKAQAMGELAGQVKIISEKETMQILGVHIVGAHATDLIGEATLAMQNRLTVRQLAETIHVHPSLSEALLEAAHGALDQPLHMMPS